MPLHVPAARAGNNYALRADLSDILSNGAGAVSERGGHRYLQFLRPGDRGATKPVDHKKLDKASIGQASSAAMRKNGNKALRAKWARKGGRKRAKTLTPERRREIAQMAADARWAKNYERREPKP